MKVLIFYLSNVDKLNISSNEAANLEETAAALEEITSNIKYNTKYSTNGYIFKQSYKISK